MGSYNKKSIARKVIRSKAFAKGAERRMASNLTKAKRIMVNEFDNHPVTREISQGPGGMNLTRSLGGYGNLFSFIGLEEDDSSVSKVRSLLMQIPKITGKKTSKNGISFTVSVPTVKDFRAVSRMPWEMGRSWVEGVETGISGFSYYMGNLFGRNMNKSRSKTAIQADHEVRAGAFRPMPYMSEILRKFAIVMFRGA